MGRRMLAVIAVASLGAVAALARGSIVLAQGGASSAAAAAAALPAPTPWTFVVSWQFDPTVWLPAIASLVLWQALARRVNRAHPGHRVSRARTAAFVAGVAVLVYALDSGVGLYDDTLFSDHMVQHLLLMLVAPPLLLLAGPITLLLQASPPDIRRGWILPVLGSRVLRFVSRPAVAWVLFAGVLWGTHFSPVYELSLENNLVHDGEHLLYLVTALLFWLPVIGRNPMPWRLGPAGAVLFVGLQMPQMTFLAVAIYTAPAPLYPFYVAHARSWGPSVLADQQFGAAIMWIGGDLLFMALVMVLVVIWMREEERRAVREDRRLALAEARAALGGQPSGGTGAARYSR